MLEAIADARRVGARLGEQALELIEQAVVCGRTSRHVFPPESSVSDEAIDVGSHGGRMTMAGEAARGQAACTSNAGRVAATVKALVLPWGWINEPPGWPMLGCRELLRSALSVCMYSK